MNKHAPPFCSNLHFLPRKIDCCCSKSGNRLWKKIDEEDGVDSDEQIRRGSANGEEKAQVDGEEARIVVMVAGELSNVNIFITG